MDASGDATKSPADWEAEMLACLKMAESHIRTTAGKERAEALVRFHTVLGQFNKLITDHKIPPEEPCNTVCAKNDS